MVQKINTVLLLEDKSFRNDKNEVVDYTEVTAQIGGVNIRLSVKREDKSLFNHVRAKMAEGK